jgi:hypothetical protein
VLLSGVPEEDFVEAHEDLQRHSAASPRDRAAASTRSTCPQMQPGSSIMPGKVNPVIPEAVNQTGFLVIGSISR